jgi:hypothetical protein
MSSGTEDTVHLFAEDVAHDHVTLLSVGSDGRGGAEGEVSDAGRFSD